MESAVIDRGTKESSIDYFEGAPLGSLVYERTYSRVKENGQKEVWPETVRRVVSGNCRFVDSAFVEPREEEELYELLLDRQMIPAGRHLWVTGIQGRAFTQNCHTAGFETGLPEHAGFLFSELMKGGGVGANYSTQYLDKCLPLHPVTVRFVCNPDHADFEALLPLLGNNELFEPTPGFLFKIPDSREGWVEALEILLNVASNPGDPITILYDLSDVRCYGSPIRGFGGVASGPKPLADLLKAISKITHHGNLEDRVYCGHRVFNETCQGCKPASVSVTPELAMNIDHLIATAVIAGNVRRSARMSILHWDDPYIDWFLHCKTDHLNHWSTNISIEVDDEFFNQLDDPDSKASFIYHQVLDGMMRDGEPGFYNSSLASQGERTHLACTNPCGEQPLESWESCNLGHVNLAYGTDKEHERAFRLMTRFLIRSTFCDIQDPKQAEVVARNRRIGVGFFGLQEWLNMRGMRYSQHKHKGTLIMYLKHWYSIIREEADKYSKELGIPSPIKVTTIAPTGTVAKLAGTSEGIQAIYAKYYIRRVRYSEGDPEVIKLRRRGVPLEPCIYTPGTVVASFPCKDPILSRVPEELIEEQHTVSILNGLSLQATVQQYYSDNAISMTINVANYSDEYSRKTVRSNLDRALREYLPKLKGTTVFPETSRPQSPIERIDEKKYFELSSSIKSDTINSGSSEDLLEECANGACPIR